MNESVGFDSVVPGATLPPLMIAVTPTYATIGVGAPVMLGLARIIQGLSLGGEYGTSATYLTEMADQCHRGFYSSFQYVTLIGGQICALLVLLVLQKVFLTGDDPSLWAAKEFIAAEQDEREAGGDACARGGFADAVRG